MGTIENSADPGGADEALTKILAQADAAAAAEDWDRSIELYRQLLAFDRVYQGAEAKLQWALRMRDIDALYRQGKAALASKRYDDALAALRKARLMYASHYKDTDALIVEAQTAMQKETWQARPVVARTRKGCFLLGTLIGALVLLLALGACAAPAPAANSAATPAANAGNAAKLSPQQRSDMYKAAPAMTIDVNKSYTATIKTAKGNIVAELYPKDAPQHVNNFVFLARDGFYNNLTFHRVVPNFVIQGGDPAGNGTGGPGYNIPPEIKSKHSKGALAMARRGGPAQTTPSSGSQFYITLEPQPGLDGDYTVFGQVTQGMDVAAKIAVGDVIQSVTIDEK
ncbi:MAG: peptidylprolyl isomerase [Acidobacteriota bacterium]